MNKPSLNTSGREQRPWSRSITLVPSNVATEDHKHTTGHVRNRQSCSIGHEPPLEPDTPPKTTFRGRGNVRAHVSTLTTSLKAAIPHRSRNDADDSDYTSPSTFSSKVHNCIRQTPRVVIKYAKYIGPGACVAVAYIDPGNYATDVAAGVSYRFKLLFVVLLSNIAAIFLQSLCIKLGCVSGMNLAQMSRLHLPRWANLVVYIFAELAIIATDIAEVIGTAIALNMLFHIPLVAGCAISIVDVLVILFLYRPGGTIRALRAFELFVLALVFGVVICFCYQLSLLGDTSVGEVFKGYLPSSAVVQSTGLYQSIGILGATVMPHSLYLGSGMVQPRLLDFDRQARQEQVMTPSSGISLSAPDQLLVNATTPLDPKEPLPLLSSIKSCISYSTAELVISLSTFALFINSAILIIAGAALSNTPSAGNASLFSIHSLLSTQISKAAGVVFALALLLSGTSAGIICTIAGQMVSEGHLRLDWAGKPWVRRLIVRSIAITPSIVIAGAVGAAGLSTALEASQVVLSVLLPIIVAPLIWFTSFGKYMIVKGRGEGSESRGVVEQVEMSSPVSTKSVTLTRTEILPTPDEGAVTPNEVSTEPNEMPVPPTGLTSLENEIQPQTKDVNMRNHWITTTFALMLWTVIVMANIAALVFLGKGDG